MLYEDEWTIRVPWGKLVLRRRGNPDGEPVLLVHGRQDSSTVFEPLLDMMPANYHYVFLDMPGNGLSSAFPKAPADMFDYDFHHYAVMFEEPPLPASPFLQFYKTMQIMCSKLPEGPKLTRFHFLAAMEHVIAHLEWDKFHFIGHSMGCEQGLFFNAVHRNRIMKMILLDAGPTLIRMQVECPVEYQQTYYDNFYENYHWENFTCRIYSRNGALEALKRSRDLSDPQTRDLLDRNFHRMDAEQQVWHPIEAHMKKDRRRRYLVRTPFSVPWIIGNLDPCEEASQGYTNYLLQTYIRQHGLDSEQGEGSSEDTLTRDLLRVVKHMRETDDAGFLSWDNRLKSLAPTNFGNDYYYELFKTIPPTLFIVASEGTKNASPNLEYHRKAKELMDRLSKLDNYYQINVEGSHDVHYTHPERVVPHIIKFLGNNFKGLSKL